MKSFGLTMLFVCLLWKKVHSEPCAPGVSYPIPDPYDCQVYYDCIDGEVAEDSCPGNLHFNPSKQACDLAENAGCVLATTPAGEPTTEEPEPTTLPPVETTTEIIEEPTTLPPVETTTEIIEEPTTLPPVETTTEIIEKPTTLPPVETTTEVIEEPTTLPPVETTTEIIEESTTIDITTWEPTTPEPTWEPTTSEPEVTTAQEETTTEIIVETTTYWNNETTTLHPGVVCSEGVDRLPYPNSTTKYYECINGEPVVKSCKEGLYFHPIELECVEADVICKPGVQYIPHPYDCSYFYECDPSRIPQLFYCTGGLHFNPILNVCDYPENANCQVGKPPMEEEEPDCSDGKTGLQPHPSSCSKYFECANGSANIYDCPAGLHFNPVTKYCDFPENAKCGKINYTEPLCEGYAGGLLLHPSDCSKYYECADGDLKVYTCSAGLVFNEVAQTCDWPYNVNCPTAFKSREEIPPILGHPDCADMKDKYLPNSQDCSKYFRCYEGDRYELSCPNGLYWDNAKQTCDWADLVDCPSAGSIFNEIAAYESREEIPPILGHPDCADMKDKYLPNSQDCSKYFRCYEGDRYELSCPNGLYWDNAKQTCDWADLVDCPSAGSVFSELAASESKEEIPPILAHPDCADKKDKYLPNPEDCSKYFRCYEGNRYELSCPSGLHWDNSIQTCNWADFVKCP